MKKQILSVLFSIIILIFFTASILADSRFKLVKIDVPPKAKNKLLFHLEHIKEIVADLKSPDISADIEFTDLDGNPLVILGSIKKGEIKWNHKVVNGTSLLVKFKKPEYEAILGKLKEKAMRPGFLVQVSYSKKKMSRDQTYGKKTQYVETKTTLKSREITFVQLPDLAVKMKYPIKAMPGEALEKNISITVENKGTVAAGSFNVELLLSSDLQIPVGPASYSENFKEDVLLEGGRGTVESIKPGERVTLDLKGSLKIPADTTPGKYYLAVVIDIEKKIKELNEDNNKDVRFMMVSVPEAKRVLLELPDTYLIYKPKGFALKIVCQGALLSSGRDWRKCMIRPYIHQLKHVGWQGFLWEVDTLDRSVWEVKGVKFCKKGGKASEVKMKVDVKGGSKTVPPSQFILRLSNTRMEYEPAAGKFRILTFQNQVAYVSLWKFFKIKSHIFQLKHAVWADSFWQIDTFKKQISRITGGIFGKEGGDATVLNIKVTVE